MLLARAAREAVFAVAGLKWQDLREIAGRHLPQAELLRRLVPILLVAFTGKTRFWWVTGAIL